jgi:hypothetical protein
VTLHVWRYLAFLRRRDTRVLDWLTEIREQVINHNPTRQERRKSEGENLGPRNLRGIRDGVAELAREHTYLLPYLVSGKKRTDRHTRTERESWTGQIAVHANACWCSDRHAAKRGVGLGNAGTCFAAKRDF